MKGIDSLTYAPGAGRRTIASNLGPMTRVAGRPQFLAGPASGCRVVGHTVGLAHGSRLVLLGYGGRLEGH